MMKLNINTGRWIMFCLLCWQTGLFTSVAFAAIPCGNIIAPRYFYDYFSGSTEITTRAIVDCSDPFLESTEPPSPYTLMVEGREIISGESVIVPEGGTRNIKIQGSPTNTQKNEFLFHHDGDDYRYINTRAPEITDEQYLAYLSVYFSDQTDLDFYQEILLVHLSGGDTWDYFKDSEGNDKLDPSGAVVRERFFSFIDACRAGSNFACTDD